MAKPDARIGVLFQVHRQRVKRLVNNGSVRPLRKLYEDAILRTQSALEGQIKVGRGTSYTANHHRIVLAQLRVGVRQMTDMLGQRVALSAKEAQVESLRHVISNIKTADQISTGVPPTIALEEASVFYGVLQNVDPSLSRTYQTTMQAYGQQAVQRMELELGVMMAQGGSTHDAVNTVTSVLNTERWKAERIVRTEVMHAYNAAHERALTEAARTVPDLYGRWTENINDLTGQPFDDRVAADSMVLHGQIARPGGLFTLPPGNHVSPKLWGTQFRFPPNRPNDRATLAPWRPGWGIPGYFYQGARRIEVTGAESEKELRSLFSAPITEEQRAEAAMLQTL